MTCLAGEALNVLMYHSISDGAGPTCISADTFRMHVDLLAELGYQTVALEHVAAWLAGRRQLPPRPVLITFDDGFEDFASAAWPQLQARGLGAVVFMPTGLIGGLDDWERVNGRRARRLMDWDEVKRLAGQGVEFGGHSVHHGDLTRLPLSRVCHEVAGSKQALEAQLQRPVLAFAPPFGRTTAAIRSVIRAYYCLSFGTVLGRATRDSDAWDLPRVEMHYFRHPARWRNHLSGGGRWWLAARRSLRAVREASRSCWQFGPRVTST
jgi:peptidoglycan/xylan/chitin deacetylase (PgdA/CDA1 family)